MAGEPQITVVGNMVSDPELRFTPSGAAVANFTVASTPRRKDGDEWVDGEAMFIRCTVWRDYAEHVVESLRKGDRVVVHGRQTVQTYQAKDGSGDRLSILLDVEEVGPSLRFGTTVYTKATSGGQDGGQQRSQGNRPNPRGPQQSSRRQPSGGGDPWGGDEAPFYHDPWMPEL